MRIKPCVVAAFTVLSAAGLAACDEPAAVATSARPAPASESPAAGASGAALKVFIDPITGEMRAPTAAEAAAATASASAASTATAKSLKSAPPFEEVVLPDGTSMVHFGSQVEEKVCINAAGELTPHCPATETPSDRKAATQ